MSDCTFKIFQSQGRCIGDKYNTSFAPEPTIVTVDNATKILKHDHTTICFENGYRNRENHKYSLGVPGDIDNKKIDNPNEYQTPEIVSEQLKSLGINHCIYPSRNHNRDKPGESARPRFHLLMPLSGPLHDQDKFVAYCKWFVREYNGDLKVANRDQQMFGFGDLQSPAILFYTDGKCIDQVLSESDLYVKDTPVVNPPVKQPSQTNFDWFVESGKWKECLPDLEEKGWEFLAEDKEGKIYFRTPEGNRGEKDQDGNIAGNNAHIFSKAPPPFKNGGDYTIPEFFAGILFENEEKDIALAKFADRYSLKNADGARVKDKEVIQPVPTSKVASPFVPAADLMTELMMNINHPDTSLSIVSTGIDQLDKTIRKGFRPGQSITLAARTQVGKTTMAGQFLINASIKQKTPAVFVTLEMSRLEIIRRIVSNLADVPIECLDGTYQPNDMQRQLISRAGQKLNEAKFHILEGLSLSVEKLEEQLLEFKEGNRVRLVFIDQLDKLTTTDYKNLKTDHERKASVSTALKQMARKLNVPVITLAQINREGAQSKGGPRLTDLKGSGQIEQDADIVLILHKPEKGNEDVVELEVAKNRDGKHGITLKLKHTGNRFRIEEIQNTPDVQDWKSETTPEGVGRFL